MIKINVYEEPLSTVHLNSEAINLNSDADYNVLLNKPQINGKVLIDNKTSTQLGLQDTLVSGTNIKTIGTKSILGEGNLDIHDIASFDSAPVESSTNLLSSGAVYSAILNHRPIYIGTTAYWDENKHFVGNKGDVVIYTDYKTIEWTIEGGGKQTKNVPGAKVLDGVNYLINQPFITSGTDESIEEITQKTPSWNHKITVGSLDSPNDDGVEGETLIITRS